MTNLEYIKSLGAKEIADLICGEEGSCEMCVNKAYICDGQSCSDGIITWLLSEHEEKLKPCPFCGGEARLYDVHESEWGFVFCNECSAEVRGKTKAEAIESWNRRAEHEIDRRRCTN